MLQFKSVTDKSKLKLISFVEGLGVGDPGAVYLAMKEILDFY